MADCGFPHISKRLREITFFMRNIWTVVELCRRRYQKIGTNCTWRHTFGFLISKTRHFAFLKVYRNLEPKRLTKNVFKLTSTKLRVTYQDFDMANFPTLIYNCDETGLSSVPGTATKGLSLKGTRQVQKLTIGERGTLTTLLVSVNAAGDSLPTKVTKEKPNSKSLASLKLQIVFDPSKVQNPVRQKTLQSVVTAVPRGYLLQRTGFVMCHVVDGPAKDVSL